MKLSRPKQKKKAVSLAKSIAKERDGYKCVKCGRSKKGGWQIHGSHIIPVTYDATASDPDNIISMCATCHSMGKDCQHQNPVPFTRWLDKKYPKRYDKLWKIARNYYKNPFPKIDWEERFGELNEGRKAKKNSR